MIASRSENGGASVELAVVVCIIAFGEKVGRRNLGRRLP